MFLQKLPRRIFFIFHFVCLFCAYLFLCKVFIYNFLSSCLTFFFHYFTDVCWLNLSQIRCFVLYCCFHFLICFEYWWSGRKDVLSLLHGNEIRCKLMYKYIHCENLHARVSFNMKVMCKKLNVFEKQLWS